jgi:hypothetical protein
MMRKTSGDISTETEARQPLPLPPLSSSASEPMRSSSPFRNSKSSKFSCALSALKCSSRASEEENSLGSFPVLSTKRYDSTIADFEGTRTKSPATSPFSSPQTNNRKGQQRRPSTGYESDASSVLLELSEVDDTTFEDFEDEGDGHVLHPSRTPSDDTHDTPNVQRNLVDFTHDTPNADNRNRRNLVLQPDMIGKVVVPDADFDEFCQSNFNTPRMLHSKGSLGDSITPLVSPEQQQQQQQEDEYDEYHTRDHGPSSSLDADTKNKLQLPNMHSKRDPALRGSLLSYGSSASFLLGETISNEQKMTENISEIVESNRAYEKADGAFPRSLDPPTNISIDENTRSASYQSLHPEESSCSSVSSFVHASNEKANHGGSQTPSLPPFFWRTHPAITVHSCDFQQNQEYSRNAFRNSNESDDLLSVDIDLPMNEPRAWIWGKSASFNSAVGGGVRTTGSRVNGAPSGGSAALVQSFTLAANKFAAVFTSPDGIRLRSTNHA